MCIPRKITAITEGKTYRNYMKVKNYELPN